MPLTHPPRDPNVATAKENAIRALEDLYGLTAIGVRITGTRIVGEGGSASADIYLHTGDTLTFENMHAASRPNSVLTELAATIGATPTLKQRDCVKAIAILHLIARREKAMTADDASRFRGEDYFGIVDVIDIDMSAQGERWGAIEAQHIRDRNGRVGPETVLRHLDGTVYVRTNWVPIGRAAARAASPRTPSRSRCSVSMGTNRAR